MLRLSNGLALCALTALGALETRPAAAEQRGAPPSVVSFDAVEADSNDSRPRMAAMLAPVQGADAAEAETDALGRGLNLAKPGVAGGDVLGAAFDQAVLDDAAKLTEWEGPVAPERAYPAALYEALKKTDKSVRAVYFAADYAPIWIQEEGDVAKAQSLLAALSLAEAHALPAERYGREDLLARLQELNSEFAVASRRRPVEPADAAPETDVETADAAKLGEKAATETFDDLDAAAAAAAARATYGDAEGAKPAAVDAPQQAESSAAPATVAAMNVAIELDYAKVAALELDLTRAYLTFAADMSVGFIEPGSLSKHIDVERPEVDQTALLLLAKRADDLTDLAQNLAPQTEDYQRLLVAYSRMRAVAAHGDWGPEIKAKRSVRLQDRGENVDDLRARLIKIGFLSAKAPRTTHPENGATLFDELTETALKRFQSRHGLASDGVAGANTKAALNVSAAERVAQLAANLERARWMHRAMDGRRVQVNIPDYHVDLLQDGKPVYRSRVVVGKPRHETPEFNDEMTTVIVNPYWHVPRSIATKELLPQLQENRNAMKRQNIAIYKEDGRPVNNWFIDWDDYSVDHFPFRMRQNPGPGNALGEVKFIFPNKHAVYLHDTPAKSLFMKSRRAFSHGCIRVHKPQLLAKTLLSVQSNDPAAEYASLRSVPRETQTPLKKRVPVHIVYRTAWVEPSGALQLRQDVYGRDALLIGAMRKAGANI